jgi:hypothetical protein
MVFKLFSNGFHRRFSMRNIDFDWATSWLWLPIFASNNSEFPFHKIQNCFSTQSSKALFEPLPPRAVLRREHTTSYHPATPAITNITMATATRTTTSSALPTSNFGDGHRQQAPTKSTSTAFGGGTITSSTIVATSNKNISIQVAPTVVGTVKERIQMFGGDAPPKPEPRTLIQKRRSQLSTKWGTDATKKVATRGACGRTGIIVADQRKVEWYTNTHSGTIYKKRIALQSFD